MAELYASKALLDMVLLFTFRFPKRDALSPVFIPYSWSFNLFVTNLAYKCGVHFFTRKAGGKMRFNLFVALLLCATIGSAAAETNLNGAGATFPNPIYQKWFSEFHNANKDVTINYQSIGSGAGIKQVTAGTVDFGASDGPMNDNQIFRRLPSRSSTFPRFSARLFPRITFRALATI